MDTREPNVADGNDSLAIPLARDNEFAQFVTVAQVDARLEAMHKTLDSFMSTMTATLNKGNDVAMVGTRSENDQVNPGGTSAKNATTPGTAQPGGVSVEKEDGEIPNSILGDAQFLGPEYMVCSNNFHNLRPLKFQGLSDPEEAERWMIQMEKFFESLGYKEEYKVPLATLNLVGDADHRWRALKATTTTPRSQRTWKWFLREFYAQ